MIPFQHIPLELSFVILRTCTRHHSRGSEMVRFSYIIMVALLGDKMRLAEPYFMYYT